MGREVKRVLLDFDWPLSKTWPGYKLTLCDDDCDSCFHFAKLASVPQTDGGCPKTNIEPHEGEGYQIWETVSEGSPVSPVFAKPEDLANWMVENDTSIMRDATYEDWIAFIDIGWAPSMTFTPTQGLRSGVASSRDLD